MSRSIDAVLFGHPVKHSRSPEIYRALEKAGGPVVRYGLLDVSPGDLAAVVQELRAGRWDAAGVTVPHKRALFSMVDEVTDIASEAGTINCISRREGGRLIATNTDGPGFLRALHDFAPQLAVSGLAVLILGTGGAACGAAASLRRLGARITMVSRAAAHRGALVPALADRIISWDDPALVEVAHESTLIVQATPIGMPPDIERMAPLPSEAFLTRHLVVDMIYNPWETRFLATARERGARCLNGWPMLVYQAMDSLEFWLGPGAGRDLPQAVRQIERRDPTRSVQVRRWSRLGVDAPQLSTLRSALRELDVALLDLLSRRMRLVEPIADEKHAQHRPIRDASQEDKVLDWARGAASQRDLSPDLTAVLFQSIMDMSCAHQAAHIQNKAERMLHVGYRGEDGSLSHLAATRRYRNRMQRVKLRRFSTFREVFQAVSDGRCDVAVVPLESVVIGGILPVCRLLVEEGLTIIGEEAVDLELCLLGRAEATLDSITTAHAPAGLLRQCGRFLEAAGLQPRVVPDDSAAAARALLDCGDRTMGVIAGEATADRLGLAIIQRGIQDSSQHSSRFVEIARAPSWLVSNEPHKSILSLTLQRGTAPNTHRLLTHYGAQVLWHYALPRHHPAHDRQAIVEISGVPDEPANAAALGALRGADVRVRVLGSYPMPST
jgi:shikimate dehydrogenase